MRTGLDRGVGVMDAVRRIDNPGYAVNIGALYMVRKDRKPAKYRYS